MNRAAHFDAILTRARTRPNLNVHDATAPLNADGTVVRASYVVLHDLGADEIGDRRYTKGQSVDSARVMRVVGRCVGADAAAARRVAEALAGQLVGWVPSVPDRTCWPMALEEERDVKLDTDVSPPLAFIDLDFTYRTMPGG